MWDCTLRYGLVVDLLRTFRSLNIVCSLNGLNVLYGLYTALEFKCFIGPPTLDFKANQTDHKLDKIVNIYQIRTYCNR